MQKNGYTFATVYNSKCVSVFLHQTIEYLGDSEASKIGMFKRVDLLNPLLIELFDDLFLLSSE